KRPYPMDLVFGYCQRLLAITNQPDRAKCLQDAQSILQENVDEQIAWEKGQGYQLLSVFPPAHSGENRKKILDPFAIQLRLDHTFVTAPGIQGKPG
ncbi:MAG TPA: hypothetical protein VMW38_21325, partial [Terriglobia bacterium]|nr:hypothetical protein [Terriglobia bacterium]